MDVLESAKKQDRVMRMLKEAVIHTYELSEEDVEIKYNRRKTAASLFVHGVNVCGASREYGMSFAVWYRSGYHDKVKDLLKGILDRMGLVSKEKQWGDGKRGDDHTQVTVMW